MGTDTYTTIVSPSQGMIKDKGSRFIAFAYPVSKKEEIKPILDILRKEHHEARHHCFAYVLGQTRNEWRANDDGEPSGTAGKPILGQINSSGLTNILIVVVRYFGGTLLGVSGLISAYRSAAAAAIKSAGIIECTLKEFYEVSFPYIVLNDIMKIIKDENMGHSDQTFDTECRMKICFRISAREKILAKLSRIEGLRYNYLETH